MRKAVDLLRDDDQSRTAHGLRACAWRRCDCRCARLVARTRPSHVASVPARLPAGRARLDGRRRHDDRELVDLIWFPTGGGKTEAYLGLAAIEIFRRRLAHGAGGGGTAVITRYTLRLLTAQQFQRAASLVCAMELLRRPTHRRPAGAAAWRRSRIGLWVGNEVTPGTAARGKGALERLHKAARPEEANQFQVESCPWCDTALLPDARSHDRSTYGVELVGRRRRHPLHEPELRVP